MRKESVKIGIVVPCFNAEKTIRETLISIIEQGYSDLDVVVVDGASTDATLDIIKEFEGAVRWVSEPDSGQTEAINKGFRMIDAEIVKWVNADDVVAAGAFEQVARHFESNPSCDFLYGDIEFIGPVGEPLGIHREPKFSKFVLLYGHNLFADPSCYWRYSAMKEVGFLTEDIKYSMDYELWVKFCKAKKVFNNIPVVLSKYRLGLDNASISNKKRMRSEHFEILIHHTAWLKVLPSFLSDFVLRVGLIASRIYKKILSAIQRGDFSLFKFSRSVQKMEG